MELGMTLFLSVIAIVVILVLVRFKKFKHELFAIFLIALILFGVFSFSMAFKGKNISFASLPDLEKAAQIYLSWVSSAVGNMKVLTAQVVKMNWQGNKTA